jgi:RsiW-degrading membrane proteinase PrsW (M82 family)
MIKQPFLNIIGTFVFVGLIINLTFKEPTFKNIAEQANFELLSNQPEQAEKSFLIAISDDEYNYENHYNYINAHFEIPEKKKVGKRKYIYRDDNTIKNEYQIYSESNDKALQDIGHYGKGLILVNLEEYEAALEEYLLVKNQNNTYFNNSIGNVYKHLANDQQAEIHFRKEISLHGNLPGAYSNLINLLFYQNKIDELHQFLNDKEIIPYFPSKIEREIYFIEKRPFPYFVALIQHVYDGINIFGFTSAFLIMCCWVIYLRKLDIFESELWKHTVITLLLGMAFSFLTYPLSDFDNLFFKFNLNGNVINDFFYSIIGIGAIEELVKIIPLLLMLRYTKAINEPFDYIKYASLSALGFAFIENLLYFNESSLHIIHGRALTAVVSHMFDSSIIAYGLILNRYKRQKNSFLNFLLFWALASVSHGFYDFWLINKTASIFQIVSIVYVVASMYMWNSLKNNALNHSTFYDKNKFLNVDIIESYLFYSLSGILIFEYLVLGIKFSPDVANQSILTSLYSGTYLTIFLALNLGKFTIVKGEWVPIKYWDKEVDEKEEEIKLANKNFQLIGSKLVLGIISNNEFTSEILPNHGNVVKKCTISNEPKWYLLQLEKSFDIDSYKGDFVLITTKDTRETILKKKNIVVALYIIPKEINLDASNINRTELTFCGWATVD